MKRVDHMIKYLSGELSPEDSRLFEKELSEDPELEKDFADVSLAFGIIGDQLREKDEEAFKEALSNAMNNSGPSVPAKKRGKRRSWFWVLAMAASLAILLSIIITRTAAELDYMAWYHPGEDPVIALIQEETRGSHTQELSRLWQEGNYQKCRILAEARLNSQAQDEFALLYYLLSSLEADDVLPAIELLNQAEIEPGPALGSALTWYHALALIRAGQDQQAITLLGSLENLPGPYRADAHKLKKKLIK